MYKQRKTILLSILLFLLISFGKVKAADTLKVLSSYIPVPDTVLVFTPRGYRTSDSAYPLVYMLHGYGGNYSQINKIIDLQYYADKYRFVIACPDGLFDSWYFNSPVDPKMQYESFFVEDLYPEILKDYRIDSNNIFITGLSMGGHGSMYLFLRHAKMFKAAASSSGVLDLNYSALKYSSLSDRLGEYDKSKNLFDKFSAINQLDSIKFSDKEIFADCGTKDYLLKANKKFNEACMDRWIQITFMTMNGRHNYKYWRKSLPWHFDFFRRVYGR